jgi:plastocyanin
MSKGLSIAIGIAVVVLLGIGFAVTHAGNKAPAYATPTPSTSSTPATAAAAATITYTTGFSPAMTTVKSGQTVTFKNDSSSDIQVDSDPHPTHTDDADLNVGTIAAGQSKTVTVTKVGDFGFHNHLNPSDAARITIQ